MKIYHNFEDRAATVISDEYKMEFPVQFQGVVAVVKPQQDLVKRFKYEHYGLSKEDYNTYLKRYMQKILPSIKADRVQKFKEGCAAFLKFVQTKIDNDLKFYLPSDCSDEGAIIYSRFQKESDEFPTFYYLLEGLPSFGF